MSNELVDLVLFHGRNAGLFSFDLSEMRSRYQSNDFASSAWLPIYEVERRGWDTSPSFSKIGAADDADNLYQHLSNQGVEFYITDQDHFEVSAFDGWHLTQAHFENHGNDAQDEGDSENYLEYFHHNHLENYV
jgi:hypothetical protein